MIYFVRAVSTNLVKIGFTAGPVEVRIRALQTGCPHDLELLHAVPGDIEVEALMHQHLAPKRARGEWFALSDGDIDDLKLWSATDVLREEWSRRTNARKNGNPWHDDLVELSSALRLRLLSSTCRLMVTGSVCPICQQETGGPEAGLDGADLHDMSCPIRALAIAAEAVDYASTHPALAGDDGSGDVESG